MSDGAMTLMLRYYDCRGGKEISYPLASFHLNSSKDQHMETNEQSICHVLIKTLSEVRALAL